jgi:hypothetical protein
MLVLHGVTMGDGAEGVKEKNKLFFERCEKVRIHWGKCVKNFLERNNWRSRKSNFWDGGTGDC